MQGDHGAALGNEGGLRYISSLPVHTVVEPTYLNHILFVLDSDARRGV